MSRRPDPGRVEWALVTGRVALLQRDAERDAERRQARRDAETLAAEYPAATVEPCQLRDGQGLAASWHGCTVAGTAGEVREWLAGQAPLRAKGTNGVHD